MTKDVFPSRVQWEQRYLLRSLLQAYLSGWCPNVKGSLGCCVVKREAAVFPLPPSLWCFLVEKVTWYLSWWRSKLQGDKRLLLDFKRFNSATPLLLHPHLQAMRWHPSPALCNLQWHNLPRPAPILGFEGCLELLQNHFIFFAVRIFGRENHCTCCLLCFYDCILMLCLFELLETWMRHASPEFLCKRVPWTLPHEASLFHG